MHQHRLSFTQHLPGSGSTPEISNLALTSSLDGLNLVEGRQLILQLADLHLGCISCCCSSCQMALQVMHLQKSFISVLHLLWW